MQLSSNGPAQNFFFRIREMAAPMRETNADRRKALVKVPDTSFIQPAIAGPMAWPILWERVTKPRAAGASFPPTASPAAAAIIVGTTP